LVVSCTAFSLNFLEFNLLKISLHEKLIINNLLLIKIL
jgi:hypothetical protein